MRPRVPWPTGTEIGAPVRPLACRAAQPVAGTQRDGTHHAVAQLLLHFQRQALLGERGTLVDQGERFVDLGHVIAGELNIHHGADALNDGSVAHVDSLLDSFCRSAAGLHRGSTPTISKFLLVIAA